MRSLFIVLCCLIALSPIHGEQNENREEGSVKERFPRVLRTFIPEAGPSAFAIQFSPNLGLCYDVLRGGVNQIWDGAIDLNPTNLAKINQPAVIPESIFYEEHLVQPLHLGALDAPVERRLKGYRYENESVVFEYTINGHLVLESLKMTPDGSGLERIFQLPKQGGDGFFQMEPQSRSEISVEGGSEQSPGLWVFPAGSKIQMFIRPRQVVSK